MSATTSMGLGFGASRGGKPYTTFAKVFINPSACKTTAPARPGSELMGWADRLNYFLSNPR